MSDTDVITQELGALLGSVPITNSLRTPPNAMDQALRLRVLPLQKPAADGAAATTTAEVGALTAEVGMIITAITFTPNAAAAQDAANTAKIIFTRRDAAGGANSAQVAQWDTTTGQQGSLAAWTEAVLALTSGNVQLAKGQQLTWQITKAGTGVVVPAGNFTIQYREA